MTALLRILGYVWIGIVAFAVGVIVIVAWLAEGRLAFHLSSLGWVTGVIAPGAVLVGWAGWLDRRRRPGRRRNF